MFRFTRGLVATCLFIGGSSWFSPAEAGEARTHDGFLLRLSLGFGLAGTSAEYAGNKLELSGETADLNFAIGGTIATNLSLHGTIWGWLASDPGVKANGTDVGSLDGDLSTIAFGGGLTYYIMPANLYLSGSVGTGSLELDLASGDGNTDNGVLVDFTFGKEWWVSNSWGLGLAGAVGFHSVPDGGLDATWSGPSFGLRFSATLN